MKKAFFLLFFLAFGLNSAFSQSEDKPVEIEKALLKKYLSYDNRSISPKQVCQIVEDVPEAYRHAQIGYDLRIARNTCFIISGANLVGYICCRFLPQPYDVKLCRITGVTCLGSLVLGVTFGAISNSHSAKAAQIYNATIGETAYNKVNLGFGFTPNGIGLTLSF